MKGRHLILHQWPLICIALLCLFTLSDFAPASGAGIEFTSSPNPVGSGARAIGMGGAFIAVADDATAASWNPGGLIQLERPELSVVVDCLYRRENNNFADFPGASGKDTIATTGINYLSAAYPFTLYNHNMIVSLSYQHLYDFSRDWSFTLASPDLRTGVKYNADGGLYAYGIAYSVQLMPQLSFGFTLNIWQNGIYHEGWQATSRQNSAVRISGNEWWTVESVNNDRWSFQGFNTNLGVLWNITDQLTLGTVFKTPFTADLQNKHSSTSTLFKPRQRKGTIIERESTILDENLDMPMSYGLGLAYRFSDRLTVSADVYRTEWGSFVRTDSQGIKYSAVTNLPLDQSEVDATTQVHLGAEYLFIKPEYTIPIRAGLFYDPGPAQGSPDDYFGFSLGSGIGFGRYVFDIAYQFRYGRNVGSALLKDFSFSQNMAEHSFYTSLIVHF
jgi:long-subunit fatty acid transport protein